jgi:hypothetical protein
MLPTLCPPPVPMQDFGPWLLWLMGLTAFAATYRVLRMVAVSLNPPVPACLRPGHRDARQTVPPQQKSSTLHPSIEHKTPGASEKPKNEDLAPEQLEGGGRDQPTILVSD